MTDFPPPPFPNEDVPAPVVDEVKLAPDGELEQFYDTKYVAGLFSVAIETVTDWIKRGDMRAIKIDGGRWRIPKSAVIEFANERYVQE